MPGRNRGEGPSVQLLRLRSLILQLEKYGHPDWKDEDGEPLTHVSNAEFSRRTGIPTSYLNAIKHPDRSGNVDIGAAKLAQVAEGVGLDIRFFFDGYKGERDFMIYLLAHKREQKQADEATQRELAKIRAEMADVASGIRHDMASTMQSHKGELAAVTSRLLKAEARSSSVEAKAKALEDENRRLTAELRQMRISTGKR